MPGGAKVIQSKTHSDSAVLSDNVSNTFPIGGNAADGPSFGGPGTIEGHRFYMAY